MHKNTKLLVIVVALLIIAVMGTLFVQMIQNQKNPSNSIRVACVGDSITEGSDYPNDLWMLLGKNYTVGNFGHGGTTVSLDTPTSYISQPTFQKAKEFSARLSNHHVRNKRCITQFSQLQFVLRG